MSYRIDWEARGAHVSYSGMTGIDEIAELARSIQASERYDRMVYILHDFLGIDGVRPARKPFAIEELSAVDAAASLNNPGIRIAVVTADAKVNALAEAYMDTWINKQPMRIFATLADARKWIGVKP